MSLHDDAPMLTLWPCRLDCQEDLSKSITKLNAKSKLFVLREAPQTVLPKIFKSWRISHLVFEKDTDAYARERDEKVIQLAKDAGVQVIVKVGRTLYDPDELVKANGGKPTMSITQVEHVSDHCQFVDTDIDRTSGSKEAERNTSPNTCPHLVARSRRHEHRL